MLEARIAPATFVVVSLADSGPGTLRQAILDANVSPGADEVIFERPVTKAGAHLPLKGSILLRSDLPPITDDITIHDPFTTPGRQNITINGYKHRIFVLADTARAESMTIADLKLTNGESRGGGALEINALDGEVTLSNLYVTKNRAAGDRNYDTSEQFARGGGILVRAGTVTLEFSKVTLNSAIGGGADRKRDGGWAYGGGIHVSAGAQLAVHDSLIAKNVASGANGGGGTDGYVFNFFIIHGSSGGDGGYGFGGGISNFGELTVTKSTITSNIVKGGAAGNGGHGVKPQRGIESGGDGAGGGEGGKAVGGGISNSGGHADVKESVISANKVLGGGGGVGGNAGDTGFGIIHFSGDGGVGGAGCGGGIENRSGTLVIESSTIAWNLALSGRGGSGGKTGIPGSSATSPDSIGFGGGIWSSSGSLSLSLVTVAKNTSPFGAGVDIDKNTFTKIQNSTIARNVGMGKNSESAGLAVLLDDQSSPVSVISTIIGQNTARKNPDLVGAIVSDHNLIQNPAGAIFTDPNTITAVSPLLGQLKSNGGPTPTLLPSSGSPVIDKGANPNALATDQRGLPRVQPVSDGTADIGAVERAAS